MPSLHFGALGLPAFFGAGEATTVEANANAAAMKVEVRILIWGFEFVFALRECGVLIERRWESEEDYVLEVDCCG